MRQLAAIPAFFLYLAAMPPQASATPVTLGLSSQNFGLTGIGGNASGDGQSTVTWGTCAFDGTNTNCTLSGQYTGLGTGGAYSFVLSYPGNGAFPLIAVSRSPGNDQITFQAKSTYSLVITLAENNGPTVSFYSFANFSFQFSGPTCTGVSTCAVGQVGLTVNATITGQAVGSFDPTPSITPSGVLSAGNYGGFQAIAPGTWIEIYGINLATTRGQVWASTDFNGNQAPSALGGTKITVGGIPAFVDYVSPGQVNAQVPSGVATGSQPVVVTTAGGSSAAYNVTVNAVEPGLLAPPAFFVNGNQNVVALLAGTLTYILPVSVPGAATARAKPGQSLNLYGIGFGPVTPDIPAGQIAQQTNALQGMLQITFAGTPATVTYAGLSPGFVGLYQFNVVVPNVATSDTVPLAFTLGGAAGPQNLVIAVQN
jgi:uncharacterized protein (TIGR03437 family)